MNIKIASLIVGTAIVLGIAALPTQWFTSPPHCPTCGKWAQTVKYDGDFIYSTCTCGEDWAINKEGYGEPAMWWEHVADVQH